MTALGQGSAGVALVMCFALLRTRQTSAASILLALQSVAVALGAVVLHRPLLAIPPLILSGGVWFACSRTAALAAPLADTLAALHPRTEPVGGAKLGIAAGAALAILCQSQGDLALPLAIVLLSVLLAATRPHPLMRVMALVGVQNGLMLAGCLVIQPEFLPPALLSSAFFPVAGLVLPLTLGAALLTPTMTSRGRRAASWPGWVDLAVSVAVFAATLIVPLDALASVFAPLLGLDGVLRSWNRRKRSVFTPAARGLALLQTSLMVLAVCAPMLIAAWLVILVAIAVNLLRRPLPQRQDDAALAVLAAGVALFGLLLLTATSSVLGYFSLFAGFAAIAATVPDLAVVLVVLLLRFADQMPWPPAAEALGISIALIALFGAAILLARPARRHRATLLQLSQCSIAALSICIGHSDGRFAALILMILLILSRSAARALDGSVGTLAIAGLGGVPPLGVFPGLVLVVLAMTNHDAWLLLPLGAAAIPIILASLPRRLPGFSPKVAIPSIFWLPLMLALLIGYLTPNGLVMWLHALTAGRS